MSRAFMQCPAFGSFMKESDQSKGVEKPALAKPVSGDLIRLPLFSDIGEQRTYVDLLDERRSIKRYEGKTITQEQLAFILWSVQGIQRYNNDKSRAGTLRPVPSGGGLHPFETYIATKHVEGLNTGLYRYVPLEDIGDKRVTLEILKSFNDYENDITNMLAGQKWVSKASAVLFFSCIPYRAEWRYGEAAHRVTLIGLGHVGQNIMLSATAADLGSCCLASYDQRLCDKILGIDGVDEFVVYVAAVG